MRGGLVILIKDKRTVEKNWLEREANSGLSL